MGHAGASREFSNQVLWETWETLSQIDSVGQITSDTGQDMKAFKLTW